jgi:lysozyme family protein
MTPEQFAAGFIRRWEDGGSTDPVKTHSLQHDDNGNWTGGRVGVGQLVGSQHGVTPQALAAYRKVSVGTITLEQMRALSIEEAGQIALAKYFYAPRLDRLPWNQLIASVFDMGWGTGPGQAIKLLQRQIGADDDGLIGPATVAALNAHIVAHGIEAAAWQFAFVRARFYASITVDKPTNLKFINGWLNRTESFAPNSAWWAEFSA